MLLWPGCGALRRLLLPAALMRMVVIWGQKKVSPLFLPSWLRRCTSEATCGSAAKHRRLATYSKVMVVSRRRRAAIGPSADHSCGGHDDLLPIRRLPRSPSHPCPKPTNLPNHCSLKPLTPETPEEPLLLVLPQRRLTLQVVWRSLPRFQLPRPSTCAR